MKIPEYATEGKLNGSFKILRYNTIEGIYEEIKGEVYLSKEDAKNRAKELNKGTKPISIPD